MESWQDTLTGLRQGATDYPKLAARWHSKEKRWTLYSEEGTHGVAPADPDGERAFKAAARAALALTGKPAGLAQPWWVWLDLLREGNRGFRRTKKIRSGSFSVARPYLDDPEEGTELIELPEQTYTLLKDGDISGIFHESAELFEDIVPNPNGTTEPNPDQASRKDAGPTVKGTNPAESAENGRKRGPKSDYESAARVAEIVASVAPDGDWHSKLDDICEALDDADIPSPAKWRKRHRCTSWGNYPERALAVKAIEYRLKIAKQRKKATPETLS